MFFTEPSPLSITDRDNIIADSGRILEKSLHHEVSLQSTLQCMPHNNESHGIKRTEIPSRLKVGRIMCHLSRNGTYVDRFSFWLLTASSRTQSRLSLLQRSQPLCAALKQHFALAFAHRVHARRFNRAFSDSLMTKSELKLAHGECRATKCVQVLVLRGEDRKICPRLASGNGMQKFPLLYGDQSCNSTTSRFMGLTSLNIPLLEKSPGSLTRPPIP